MKCPVCKEPDLVMSERQGIEIDYCPSCRGIWLDRGELDKIIEKSMESGVARPNPEEAQRILADPYYEHRHHHDDHYDHDRPKHWKRKSCLPFHAWSITSCWYTWGRQVSATSCGLPPKEHPIEFGSRAGIG